MQPRLLFTFGTLFEPKIITALLGTEPAHFSASVQGYGVFKGEADDLSDDMKVDIAKRHDLSTFSFLFAKKALDQNAIIDGKAYQITTNQELILDFWERYPRWYRKEDVTVEDQNGIKHHAFVYVIDRSGVRVNKFERVQGDIKKYIEGAKLLRKKIKKEFPAIVAVL